MNVKLPQVVIKYNRFLDPIFIAYIKSQEQWKDWIIPKKEDVLEQVKKYTSAWQKYNDIILNGLSEITGLEFKENIIYVHIVSGNPRQFSNPIVIKSSFESDEFVEVLTHELIHKLFSNNIDIVKPTIFKEMFPNEEELVQNHVVVHALLQYIYLDLLKEPNRLKNNKLRSEKSTHKGYIKAWQIVDNNGYKNIIENFKKK